MGKRSRFLLTKSAGKVIKGRLLALLCKLPRTPSSQPQKVMRGKYVLYMTHRKAFVYLFRTSSAIPRVRTQDAAKSEQIRRGGWFHAMVFDVLPAVD